MKRNICILLFNSLFLVSCYSQENISIGYPIEYYELFGTVKKVEYIDFEKYNFDDSRWDTNYTEASGFYGPYSLFFNEYGYQIAWMGDDENNKGVLKYLQDDSGDLMGYEIDFNYKTSKIFPMLNTGKYEEINTNSNYWRILNFKDTNIYDAWGKDITDDKTIIFHYRSSKNSKDSFIEMLEKIKTKYIDNPLKPSFDQIICFNNNGSVVSIQYPEGEVLTFDNSGLLIKRSNAINYTEEIYLIKSPESHIRTYNFADAQYSVKYDFILDSIGNWISKTITTKRESDNWTARQRITRNIEYY